MIFAFRNEDLQLRQVSEVALRLRRGAAHARQDPLQRAIFLACDFTCTAPGEAPVAFEGVASGGALLPRVG